LEDVYAGGGGGQPASLYLQKKGGSFIQNKQAAFERSSSEDADTVFLMLEIILQRSVHVASGGYHNYTHEDALLQDRLYINDGKETFLKAANTLPKMLVSKSCVRITDFNGDGYIFYRRKSDSWPLSCEATF